MASDLTSGPGDMVVGWDPLTQDYRWDLTYFWDFGEVDFALEDSCGYWVYSSTVKSISLYGSIPAVSQWRYIDVPDAGGWVMVGLLGMDTPRWASDIVSMFEGSIDLIVGWDPSIQDYRDDLTYFPMWGEIDFQLTPGMCYWVYFQGDGMLQYVP
jgi:hypothetical protein